MFEELKEKLKKRIEENSYKSILNWKDAEGEHTEQVYMKRSKIPIIGDWTRIYPPVNENNTWNIVNLVFGGRKNLIKLLLILGIISLLYYGIYEMLESCRLLAKTCVPTITEIPKNLSALMLD